MSRGRTYPDADLLRFPQGATTSREKRWEFWRKQAEAERQARERFTAAYNAAVRERYPDAVEGDEVEEIDS
jgi:hypothetical protein